jgi:two-component system OmpR family response regulator
MRGRERLTMPKSVLIVDDDPMLRDLLQGYLSENGYAVQTAADGKAMREQMVLHAPDLIILDIMLPEQDGLTLCRDLRTHSNIPILMLTARGDELDRILGLEMGADDYLPKPFSPRELLARIKSILRRAEDGGAKSTPPTKLRFAGWTLDLVGRQLMSSEGVVTALSTGEFRLLQLLATHANRVLSRDQLLEAMAGREAGPFDRTIDVMISRLRRRLADDGREPQVIKTIRNEGYMLAVPVEAGK